MTTASGECGQRIARRPIADGDMPFLFALYSTTRPEIEPLPWTDEQKQAFLQHQFHAQHLHYQRFFGGAQFDVLLRDGEPVGRVYVDRAPDEYHVIDIAVLPQYRGQGIGSAVMREILAAADRDRKPVRLRVEPHNPARQWYERLGFAKIADEQTNWHMERRAR